MRELGDSIKVKQSRHKEPICYMSSLCSISKMAQPERCGVGLINAWAAGKKLGRALLVGMVSLGGDENVLKTGNSNS